jgi:hypothetical protein
MKTIFFNQGKMRNLKLIVLVLIFSKFSFAGGVPCHCLTGVNCVQTANCGVPAQSACALGGGVFLGPHISCAEALPLELVSYSLEISNNEVTINFETASERDLDYYIIESSTDGSYWQELTSIKAAGYSSENNNYSYVDNSPFNGTSYYRLKTVNTDGSVSVLDIVACEFYSSKYLVYPIPVNSTLFIEGEKLDQSEFLLVNSIGENIDVEITSLGYKYSLNFETIKNGIYFLKIASSNNMKTERIMVCHK